MAAKTYHVGELAELAGLSQAGVKKAISDGRVRATKRKGVWEIDASDPQVREWLERDSTTASTSRDDLLSEVNRLRRENANLAKRVRQAEAAQRRAERKARLLEGELAEAYRESSERIYRLSHEVVEQATMESNRTILQVASMLAGGSGERSILPGTVTDSGDSGDRPAE